MCDRSPIVLCLSVILTLVNTAPLQLQLLPALQLRPLQMTQQVPQPMMLPLQLQMPMIEYETNQEPIVIVPAQHLMSEQDLMQELALMQMLQQPLEQPQQTLSQQHVMHQMPPRIKDSKQQSTLMQLLQQQQPMPQVSLQQQMMELQQLQAVQKLNAVQSPLGMQPPQPFLILLPNSQMTNEKEEDGNFKNANENNSNVNDLKHNLEEGYVNEELESVIIDAAPNEMENAPKRAILLIPNPNARFSIGGVISTIPWLPFEVNVPDSISWIYNGISGIISIIGQRLPFRPKPPMAATVNPQETSVKMFLKQLQMKQDSAVPMFVLPMERIRVPLQV